MSSRQVQRVANCDHRHETCGQWQNGTVVTMENKTPFEMQLSRSKNWSGIPSTGSFPTTIAPNGTTSFTHLRSGQYGSVGGVQYDGRNAQGVQCAWILAWQAPVEDDPPCPPNRVYVACGPKANMDAITWNQVVTSLDIAPTNAATTNSVSKTGAVATIHDLTPDTATLLASFTLTRESRPLLK